MYQEHHDDAHGTHWVPHPILQGRELAGWILGRFDDFELFETIDREGRGSSEVLVKLAVKPCPSWIKVNAVPGQAHD